MPKPPRVPSYCLHKPTGRAFVKIAGRFVYLGPYGSTASREAYAAAVADFLAGRAVAERPATPAAPAPASLTVRELAALYKAYADAYYVKGGEPTNEAAMVATACRRAADVFGDLPAGEFGPLCLEALRANLIEKGLSRSFINQSIGRVRRMFRWAGARELIPASVSHGLSLVPGLKRGRTTAHETAPVRPVADSIIDATLPHLPAVVADMVRLQRLTGMRPGEVCQLRPCDLDRSGPVWTYRPATHKTQHHGRERTVFIGPQGQEVLLRYLARAPETFCFRPCDSEAKRRAALHALRSTPLSCGNVPGSNVKAEPKRTAGEHYRKDAYARAIARACQKAKLPHWTPNQLRHTAATAARAEFGLDGVQVLLGHAHARTSEIYAEKNLAAGRAIAAKLG